MPLSFHSNDSARNEKLQAIRCEAASNMKIDFSRKLNSSVVSFFQPIEINFQPYSRDETHNILKDLICQVFNTGAISGRPGGGCRENHVLRCERNGMEEHRTQGGADGMEWRRNRQGIRRRPNHSLLTTASHSPA